MNIIFVRTKVWVLNRSFRHIDNAISYIRNLNKKYKNLEPKIFKNGELIRS